MFTKARDLLPAVYQALLAVFALAVIFTGLSSAQAPSESSVYARKNTLGILAAYAPNSSHILLGDAENRKLLAFGVSYSRRLFLNRNVNFQYDGEFLPIALEGDPLEHVVQNETSPTPGVFTIDEAPPVRCALFNGSYSYKDPTTGITYSGTISARCQGRRWTFGEAISPVGFQWNFLPRRKVQPIVIGHGGYIYSTRPIPTDNAGSFNFIFDIGAGVELYRTKTRSVRAEYRFHHTSNHNTANENPGVDSGLLQVTYRFGR